MHRREASGDIDARPWCQGFYAAMRLRISVGTVAGRQQSPSRSVAAHPDALLRRSGPPAARTTAAKDGEPGDLSSAHLGIPAAVEALRQYWMPIRYKRAR
jgi:uncharacterized protein